MTKETDCHFVYYWQECPNSRTNNLYLYWRIQTNDKRIADTLRQRKKCSECKIIGDNLYLFQIEFSGKRVALKSMQTLLGKHSYSKVSYNAKSGDYYALKPSNPILNSDLEVPYE